MSNTPPVTNTALNANNKATPGFSTALVAVVNVFGEGELICIQGLPDNMGHKELGPFVAALGFEANCIILSQSPRAPDNAANSPIYKWVPQVYEWMPGRVSASYIRMVMPS